MVKNIKTSIGVFTLFINVISIFILFSTYTYLSSLGTCRCVENATATNNLKNVVQTNT